MKVAGIYIGLTVAIIVGMLVIFGDTPESSDESVAQQNNSTSARESVNESIPEGVSQILASSFSDVDFASTAINFEQVLSGGPGRDGIPAISNPEFDNASVADVPTGTQGILLDIDGEQRFYPYNILVWHEIVNDQIGDTPVAVTFCPLCGSAIVFDRTVDGQVVEFGVSGFLFESNMIMYDRTDTPSLWSQARGAAVIGDQTGTELQHIPLQLLTWEQVKETYPEARVLREPSDPSIRRNYDRDPYGDYETEEGLFFPISVDDQRFPDKEIFFIVPLEGGSVALQFNELTDGVESTFDANGVQLIALREANGTLTVRDESGTELPGYYEMWFSWATHHQDDGIVWQP